jgi:hypothetical protein
MNPIQEETREIYIRLNDYDGIFSDFDMRPYSKRALSVDFLDEVKRASAEKIEGEVELLLHIPEKARNESHEATIHERLVEYFHKHHQKLLKEKARMMRIGFSMVGLGIISMIAATWLIYKDPTEHFIFSFLVVFLEPAAWFLLWEGMDQIIFTSRELNSELAFYQKMSNSRAQIHFKSY